MKTLLYLAGTVLSAAGCSTVLVSHVHSNDYDTPGVRYFIPAPYLLVKTAVEVNRVEALYSMSPIDKTVLHRVIPCEAGQASCPPAEPVAASGRPGATPGPGSPPAVRPGAGAQAGEDGASERWTGEGGESKAAKEDSAATSIVWLPDYCQQYTIVEKNHVGSQKVQIQLVDGWKISALNTEVNNSEVFQKMIEAVSNIAGSTLNPSAKAAAAGAQAASRATGSGAQSGRTRFFRRTQTITMKPGLYPLLQYPLTSDGQPDCGKLPSFRPPRDATLPSESWDEVVLSHDGAGPPAAATVDPGRPANPGKPPQPR